MMHRMPVVGLVMVLAAGLGACAPKKPPVVPAAPPVSALLPPPVLEARTLWDLSVDWAPAPTVVPAMSQLEEEPEARPARPPTEREKPPDAVPPPPPVVAEAPRLSTPDVLDEVVATRQVREMLDRARRALGTLRYSTLNTDARTQFDTATQLIQQAEDALKERNFVFAIKVADKAETLARRLVGQ